MKHFLHIFVLVFLPASLANAATFTAAANGNWNIGTTWGGACTTGCISGTDYPGTGDDAIIPSGFAVSVAGFETCRNIQIDPNTAGALNIALPFFSLTVEGSLIGYDNSSGFPSPPTVGGIISGAGTLIFTGSDVSGFGGFGVFTEVIAYWNSTASLPKVNFDFGDGVTRSVDFMYTSGFAVTDLAFTTSVNILSGTLQTGNNINGVQVTSGTLSITAGATLTLNVPLTEDGTSTSRINALTINGTIEASNGTTYINAETFSLNSGGTLTTNFSGGDQTEGWWYQTSSPTTVSINDASTIGYTASANQTVFATDIGSLFLGGSGNKSLTTSGTLKAVDITTNTNDVVFETSTNGQPIDVTGDVDNDGVWMPTQLVRFSGTNPQIIGGNNTIAFGNGVEIGDNVDFPSSSVSLNQSIDINGGLDIRTNAVLSANGLDINISGDWTNDGAYTGGSGTVTFDGTSSIFGDATTDFNDIIISGILDQSEASVATTVNVAGDFTNNGTFTPGSGTVVFNGSATQSINGSSATSFNNINAENDVDNEGTTSQTGALTLSANVTFDADGSGTGAYTLVSTATGDACILEIPSTASVSGNMTIQRYMEGEGRIWRYLTAPITSATVADWQDDFPITGTFSDPSTGDGIVSSNPSIYVYNEATAGDLDQGWEAYPTSGTASSNSLVAGTGYTAYIREGVSATTVDVTGAINQGAFNFSVGYTDNASGDDGWNIVGNPFPCAINWDNSGWTKTNLEGTVYMRDNGAGGVFATWNGTTGTNGGTGNIATGQAFWVKATSASPALAITESTKTSASATFFRKAPPSNLLRVAMIGDGDRSDDMVIHFCDGAVDGFDVDKDARKLLNEGMHNISSVSSEGEALAINSLPLLNCSKIIAINVEKAPSGTYRMEVNGLDSFDALENLERIALVDKFADKTIEVGVDGLSYSFEVSDEERSYGSERFEIEFVSKNFLPQIAQEGAFLKSSFDTGNQWYYNGELIEGATGKELEVLGPGKYTLEVNQGTCTATRELSIGNSEQVLSEEVMIRVGPNPTNDYVHISIPEANVTEGDLIIKLQDLNGNEISKGKLIKNANIWSGSFNLSQYPKGVYIISVQGGGHDYTQKVIKD